MRVLVVEDEQLLADAVATGLRREAMAVDVVYDGAAALERIGVNDYDVVVLDRDLPLVHGDDVCRRVVELGMPTRVLMLTASGDVSDRVEGLEIGDAIHISHVKLPDGVVPANQEEDFTVATIVAPSAMKSEEEAAAPADAVPTVEEGESGEGESEE